MSFNGNEGASITELDASLLTKKFRENHPNATKAYFIGANHIQSLINQTDCKGIRIYLGEDMNSNLEVVLVGADSNEDDILDLIVDNAIRCPPRCGSKNKLNND